MGRDCRTAICADRFSLGQIVEEFAAASQGGAENKVTLDYLRYAAWQQDAIKSRKAPSAWQPWRSQAVSHITEWPDGGAQHVDYLDPGADQEFYAAAAAALAAAVSSAMASAVVGVESDGRGVDDLQCAIEPLHRCRLSASASPGVTVSVRCWTAYGTRCERRSTCRIISRMTCPCRSGHSEEAAR